MLTSPILDRSAWRGPELARERSWQCTLSAEHIGELDAALQKIKRRGLRLEEITLADFRLPRFESELLSVLKEELDGGRGFFVLRGFPVEQYSDDDAAVVYFGIGQHLGILTPQNVRGDVLGHVRDEGHEDFRGTQHLRGYQTRGGLPFHTDHHDIVGLLCLRKAKLGGLSSIVSSVSMHNVLLERHPEYLGLLYKEYFYDFRGEQASGKAPVYRSALYRYESGQLTCRTANVDYIYQAQETTGIPLSAVELEALQLFQELAGSDALRLDMDLEPGDMQFLHNSVVLHSRTSYVDYDDPTKKRHLLRLWLNVPSGRRHRESAWESARRRPESAALVR